MDNDAITKVPTFRSGNFVFSWKYNRSDIDPLIYCTRLLYETVIAIPVLPQWSTRFEEEIIRQSIFGTAALEGNPLKKEAKKPTGQNRKSETSRLSINS
jgi:hypothetical protein